MTTEGERNGMKLSEVSWLSVDATENVLWNRPTKSIAYSSYLWHPAVQFIALTWKREKERVICRRGERGREKYEDKSLQCNEKYMNYKNIKIYVL